MLAYLVIREGSKWSDVFRLVPGQTVTIGRAPTNQIVLKDERCSRCHAEVFATGEALDRFAIWTAATARSSAIRLVRGEQPLNAGRHHPHRQFANWPSSTI